MYGGLHCDITILLSLLSISTLGLRNVVDLSRTNLEKLARYGLRPAATDIVTDHRPGIRILGNSGWDIQKKKKHGVSKLQAIRFATDDIHTLSRVATRS